jgi:hypothetical protein
MKKQDNLLLLLYFKPFLKIDKCEKCGIVCPSESFIQDKIVRFFLIFYDFSQAFKLCDIFALSGDTLKLFGRVPIWSVLKWFFLVYVLVSYNTLYSIRPLRHSFVGLKKCFLLRLSQRINDFSVDWFDAKMISPWTESTQKLYLLRLSQSKNNSSVDWVNEKWFLIRQESTQKWYESTQSL